MVTSWKDHVWVNKGLVPYGKAVRLRRGLLLPLLYAVAALPVGTSWLFLVVHKVQDIVLRW